jgi:hypothetical protein
MHLEPQQPNDDDHCCNTDLIFSAAKLDVYRHERLAYTEMPSKSATSRGAAKRAAMLRAMALWALAHL